MRIKLPIKNFGQNCMIYYVSNDNHLTRTYARRFTVFTKNKISL